MANRVNITREERVRIVIALMAGINIKKNLIKFDVGVRTPIEKLTQDLKLKLKLFAGFSIGL